MLLLLPALVIPLLPDSPQLQAPGCITPQLARDSLYSIRDEAEPSQMMRSEAVPADTGIMNLGFVCAAVQVVFALGLQLSRIAMP